MDAEPMNPRAQTEPMEQTDTAGTGGLSLSASRLTLLTLLAQEA